VEAISTLVHLKEQKLKVQICSCDLEV
jgi:hypothetical protein